jgi:hypothetical protein
MTVMMTAEVPGATEQQYRELNEALGITPESPPDGLITHMAARTPDGMRIVDVWQSEQAFNTFIEGAMPTMQQAGIPSFQPEMYPVHNMFEGAGTQANVMLIADLPAWGPDAYDEMTHGMDAHADNGARHPSALHVAAVKGGGLFVVDLWDAPETFGRFAQEQFPEGAAEQLGDFEPEFYPVVNVLSGKTRVSV